LKPLFMWAGGKNKMLKKYQPYLPEKFDGYCEPFLGGGAMFIWAYEKNPEARFVLNDLNKSVVQVYESIQNDLEDFLKRMDELSAEYLPLPKGETDKPLEKQFGKDWAKLYKHKPCRRYFYFMLRQEHAYDYAKWSTAEEAATLYFLMKTGFNGLWQENKNTNGRFGTPCGLMNQKEAVYDKENVLEWNKALQNADLLCGDFKDTIDYVDSGYYVFLDPPYRGSFTQYGVDFDDLLQELVIDYLERARIAGAYVLLSNRDTGDGFFELRRGNNEMIYFDVTYTAGRRKVTHAKDIVSCWQDGFAAKKAREILMIGEPHVI